MDKSEVEKLQQKKSNEEFNSVTQKVKVENKNQQHNVKKEGVHQLNQKQWQQQKQIIIQKGIALQFPFFDIWFYVLNQEQSSYEYCNISLKWYNDYI